MNPGYLKPRPPIPSEVDDVVLSDVYGGTGYLVVARKKENHGAKSLTGTDNKCG
jgi:hypothetical protein